MADLSDKIAAKLLQEYQIGWSSRFMDEPPDWDSADPDDLAQIIREVIKAENPAAASMVNPDLVEKVARAIADSENLREDGTCRTDAYIHTNNHHRHAAHAAIAAVLDAIAEPDRGVMMKIISAGEATLGTDIYIPRSAIVSMWRTMIAALRQEAE